MSIIRELSNFLYNKSNCNSPSNDYVCRQYVISELYGLDKDSIGKFGENLAKKYFEDSGYKIIEANARKRFGEIDIVAKIRKVTIFCEVKTRSSDRFGSAVESLTHTKKKRILRMIRYYCLKNRISEENIRADFIAIQIDGNTADLKHFQGIELI